MSFLKYSLILSLSLALTNVHQVIAQDSGPAIGQWKSLNSYYNVRSITASASKIYCGTSTGFFVYDINDDIATPYSKINGLNDFGITAISYDNLSGKVIIGYNSANLDIYDNGTIHNIPDIMISTLPDSKEINHITAYNNKGYIATPMGLIIVNLEKNEIATTVPFYQGSDKATVFSSTIINDTIYTATSIGIYKININHNLIQNYSNWSKISDKVFQNITSNKSEIYGLMTVLTPSRKDSVFKINAEGEHTFIYSSAKKISTIYANDDGGIYVGEEYNDSPGNIHLLSSTGSIQKSWTAYFPTAINETSAGELYFADRDATARFGGLRKAINDGSSVGKTPDGPEYQFSFDISADKDEIWMAHGGFYSNYFFIGNPKAFSRQKKNAWENYDQRVNAFGKTLVSDASYIHKNKATGITYVGMTAGGLITIDKENNLELIQAPQIEMHPGGTYIVSGITQDKYNNIWISNHGSSYEMKVITPKGEWHQFSNTMNPFKNVGPLVVDDNNTVWQLGSNTDGVYVYGTGKDLIDKTDDQSRKLSTGKLNGNLPNNNTFSIAKDNDGAIWIGTEDGIAIFELPHLIFSDYERSDADLRLVDYENVSFWQPIFKGKSVKSIAVDGSNNKWIGTENAGLWLLSNDGRKVLAEFNKNNSPLPSDNIISIDIDQSNGNVYISTDLGAIVYRGKATESTGTIAEDLFVYPNPVPSGYNGEIAIKGLVGKSEIRITDINGNLVYQFTSEGGQATWNGKDYTGIKPQSGVYLILVTDLLTGKSVKTGKFIIHD